MGEAPTPRTDAFYGCPPPESGKDWQTRGTKAERDFARQLELESARLQRENLELRGALELAVTAMAAADAACPVDSMAEKLIRVAIVSAKAALASPSPEPKQ